jgi:putative restriction endonuclease
MKYYLGVTDNKWFNYLSKINPEDINFWQPSGTVSFKALTAGAPFLFKLKSPLNAIGGIGFFSSHTFLPISIAWDTFSNRNGCDTFDEFRNMITNYRKDQSNLNPKIGCIVLTNPIFFKKDRVGLKRLVTGETALSKENPIFLTTKLVVHFGKKLKRF